MDAPVVGKRRVDVRSVGHLQAHPEDVCVIHSIYTFIHPGTPPSLKVCQAHSLPQEDGNLEPILAVFLPKSVLNFRKYLKFEGFLGTWYNASSALWQRETLIHGRPLHLNN
jgi:hypothetical protein